MKKNPGVSKGFAEVGQWFNIITHTIHARGCGVVAHRFEQEAVWD